DAGARGVSEAELLHLVEQDDGAFESETQVSVVNELLDAFFLEQAVDERKVLRQVRIENHAPYGGLDKLPLHFHRNRVRDVLVVICGGEVNDFTGVAQTNGREQLNL